MRWLCSADRCRHDRQQLGGSCLSAAIRRPSQPNSISAGGQLLQGGQNQKRNEDGAQRKQDLHEAQRPHIGKEDPGRAGKTAAQDYFLINKLCQNNWHFKIHVSRE